MLLEWRGFGELLSNSDLVWRCQGGPRFRNQLVEATSPCIWNSDRRKYLFQIHYEWRDHDTFPVGCFVHDKYGLNWVYALMKTFWSSTVPNPFPCPLSILLCFLSSSLGVAWAGLLFLIGGRLCFILLFFSEKAVIWELAGKDIRKTSVWRVTNNFEGSDYFTIWFKSYWTAQCHPFELSIDEVSLGMFFHHYLYCFCRGVSCFIGTV